MSIDKMIALYILITTLEFVVLKEMLKNTDITKGKILVYINVRNLLVVAINYFLVFR